MKNRVVKVLYIFLIIAFLFCNKPCKVNAKDDLSELEKKAVDLNHDGNINKNDLDLLITYQTAHIEVENISEEDKVNSNIFYLFFTGLEENTTSNISGTLLEVADQIHRDEQSWTYSLGSDLYWNNIEKSLNNPNKVTCCATYVACVLYKAGYFSEKEMNSFNYNCADEIYDFTSKCGWKSINNYGDLQAGDIVFTGYSTGKITHVQIYAGSETWYNAGTTPVIQASAPYSQYDWARNNFVVAVRAPN